MRNLIMHLPRYYVTAENDELLGFILRRRPRSIFESFCSEEYDISTRYKAWVQRRTTGWVCIRALGT